MARALHNNGLTVVLLLLFALSLIGQSLAGERVYNADQRDHGQPTVTFASYLLTGHFVEAVFENWESEFLQMGLYVLLTAYLFQKGSAESRSRRCRPASGAGGTRYALGGAAGWYRAEGLRTFAGARVAASLRDLVHAPRRGWCQGLQPGPIGAWRADDLDAWLSGDIAALVRVVPKLAERISLDRGGRGPLDLLAAERVAGVEAGSVSA